MQRLQPKQPTTASLTGAQSGRWAGASSVVVADTSGGGQAFVEAALLRPAPRRVRVSRAVRFVRALAWNGIAGLAVYTLLHVLPSATGGDKSSCVPLLLGAVALLKLLLYFEVFRAQRLRLLRFGVAVTGTVAPISFDFDNRGTETVRYHFQTPDGKEWKRTVYVSLSVAKRFAPGQKLTVLYDPARPDESFPYGAITDAYIE